MPAPNNITGYALGLLLLGAACGTDKPQKQAEVKDTVKVEAPVVQPVIQPPFAGIDIPFQQISVDADSGKTFLAANGLGTHVVIPGGAFIDSAGQAVSGQVTIRFRELHTLNDALVAGVPLNYDAAGLLKRLNTGGMVELRAYRENTPVYLDSGKVITVSMAAFEHTEGYHAFYLHENTTRNWHYLHDIDGVENPARKKITQRARQKVTEFNMPLGGNYFAFNYMALLDVYLNDKTVEIKKKRQDLTLQGKIKEYGVTWTNIFCFQSVDFNGTKYLASLLLWKKLNPEPWPVWGNTATCNITPGANGTYLLELAQTKGKGVYKASIQPFFPIKSLLAFSPSYWKNKYNLALRKAIQDEMRKQKIAEVFRTLEIHSFGVHGVQKLQPGENYIQVALTPEFTGEPATNVTKLYYVSPAYNTVLVYPAGEWGNITLLPDNDARLFAILPGNKIALADAAQVQKLDFDNLRKNAGTTLKLTFSTVDKSVASAADIAAILGIPVSPI